MNPIHDRTDTTVEPGLADARGDLAHRLIGTARLRRIGHWRFPTHELSHDNAPLAQVGPGGWARIYLGSGQRIVLSDGARWRLGSSGGGGGVCLVARNELREKVAVASLRLDGTYGINGKEYTAVLTPSSKPRFARANTWVLREFEEELAVMTRHPMTVDATSPVHLGAILVAFAVVRLGLPDESKPRIPTFKWGS